MIRAAVFDFGNVLCRLDRERASAAMAAHCGAGAGELSDILWKGDLERDSETGKYDSREHFRRIKAAARGREEWSYEEFREEFALCIQPHPEGEEALRYAKARGLRCFVLSNTSFIHARFIFSNECLASIPELYALSYKIGIMKPDPGIWRWLLERARLEAAECLYIDDVQDYCDVAASLGFAAIRYDISAGGLSRSIAMRL
jgi:FMN phosphatase YigB (HAD superfamily)